MIVPTGRTRARRAVVPVAVLAVAVSLFAVYLAIARAQPTDADASSNALQAWDMWHGNVLLSGWTVSDVSFYLTDLVQYAALETVLGRSHAVLPVASALTWTLIVLLTVALARGREAGRAGWWRAAIALFFVLAPTPGLAQITLVRTPDHTGTAIPVLLAWWVVDRLGPTGAGDGDGGGGASGRIARWSSRRVLVVLTLLLTWMVLSDPLTIITACLPLLLVSGVRLVRAGRWRPRDLPGTDGALAAAAVLGAVLGELVGRGIGAVGGYRLQPLSIHLTSLDQVDRRLGVAWQCARSLFGADATAGGAPGRGVLAFLHLLGVLAVGIAIVLVAVRAVLGRTDPARSRVAELVAAGILFNLGAFVVSTLANGPLDARQIAAIVPFGAVLVARTAIAPGRAPALGGRPAVRGVAAVAAVLVAVLVAASLVDSARRPVLPPPRARVAAWLTAHHLHYGLGSYWAADSITLDTGNRVRVRPITRRHGRIYAYRWEARTQWYDPRRERATFVVLDLRQPAFGTPREARGTWGPPRLQVRVADDAILVYDRNLLVGLPAWCGPLVYARSMAACD